MKSKDFDRIFDEGGSVAKFLNKGKSRRSKQQQKRVNVDFPVWMVHRLDKEAQRLGVTRQSVIKVSVAEHIQHQPV